MDLPNPEEWGNRLKTQMDNFTSNPIVFIPKLERHYKRLRQKLDPTLVENLLTTDESADWYTINSERFTSWNKFRTKVTNH